MDALKKLPDESKKQILNKIETKIAEGKQILLELRDTAANKQASIRLHEDLAALKNIANNLN